MERNKISLHFMMLNRARRKSQLSALHDENKTCKLRWIESEWIISF